MKRNNIKFAAILVIAVMIGNNGYTQDLKEDGGTEKKPPELDPILDKNKPVGEIPIISAISPSGAVTHSIPIEVYPGINGMTPQISINYNSHAGNGILGVGWNIGGLTSITRGNKNVYYDGVTDGIKMTKDDVFYLDGMRLIKLSQTSSEIKYESETGNIKVTAYLNGTIVKNFKVYYPNGTFGTYGYTTNAVNKLEYPVTSFSDLYSNTITYNYTEILNHYRINSISYASNATVVFEYETNDRPDVINYYSAGYLITENKRLEKITCKYGSNSLRIYSFIYGTLNESLERIEIKTGSSPTETFNPIEFGYGSLSPTGTYSITSSQVSTHGNFTYQTHKAKSGNFDHLTGKGNDGLAVFTAKNPFYLSNGNTIVNYYTTNELIYLYSKLGETTAHTKTLTTGQGFIDILCADVDGNYGEEVIKINNYIITELPDPFMPASNYDAVKIETYKANSSTGVSLLHTREYSLEKSFTNNTGSESVYPKYFYTGDFLGDGKNQVIAVTAYSPFSGNTFATRCYLFDLSSSSTSPLYTGLPFTFNINFSETNAANGNINTNNSDRIYIIDYDGDGKSDICLINTTGTHIYSFVKNGSTYSLQNIATYTGLKRINLTNKILLLGDFNGDGESDFLLSPEVGSGSTWNLYYSMGNGQFYNYTTTTLGTASNNDRFLLQDVDYDGRTDVIKYNNDKFWTYRKKHGDLNDFEAAIEKSFGIASPLLVPVNINSSNKSFQLIGLKNGDIHKYSYSFNYVKEKLITSALKYETYELYSYESLDQANACLQGSGVSFPYQNFSGKVYVAVSHITKLINSVIENKSYAYNNAVIHKQGLGFCGFEKITQTDNIRNRTQYQKYNPLKFGIVTEEDSHFANIKYTYADTIATNKIAKVRLTKIVANDKSRNVTVTTTYTSIDAYGSPKYETVSYGDGTSEAFTNLYFNNLNETGYLIGFLKDRTKTTTRNGTWTERYEVSAHDSKGKPNTVIKYANGNEVSKEIFTYFNSGNLETYKEKYYSTGTTFTTTYHYDSYNRLDYEINPLEFKTSYMYDTSKGYMNKIKNHKYYNGSANILETTIGYDVFGRNTSITTPDGTATSTVFSWDALGDNGLYCIQTNTTGKPSSKTYYDSMGRVTASAVMNFDGTWTKTENKYDGFGRLWKTSLPFTGSSASLWNEYTYDEYDRPLSVEEATERTTSYLYSGKNVTITKDGIATEYKYDNAGNLTSVVDPAGTITYTLRPDGQPSSIVAPGPVTTSFTYDDYGRRKTINDPSAGIQTWDYDSEGNVWKETDARGKVIEYLYDNYNRLQYINRPTGEFTTTYIYNTNGLLESETATVNSTTITQTTYTYDNKERLYTEKETVPDGKWLKKTYTYYNTVSNKNLNTTLYESQTGTLATETYTYSNGHLKQITAGGATIWKLNSVNEFMQPTSVTTGAFNRLYDFDDYGFPTRRRAGSFMDHTYNFEPQTGNLNYRKDNKQVLAQEDFDYDNLNRLTEYKGKTAVYDNKGNITKKSDIGSTFKYQTPNKPYAISGVTSQTNAIPMREQAIPVYNSFKRPKTITENEYLATFTYNGSHGRVKMEVKQKSANVLTRYYISDCYEIDVKPSGTKEKLYLGGDFYSAPAVYVKDGNNAWQIYYICRDYLGSIMCITNSSGTKVNEYSYDAWGRLRNPSTQEPLLPDTDPNLFLGRGYTGHEHLHWFGLINMNARLYDPAVGRFLSPDPIVQDATNSQNYNRYSYALNNPLKYNDPTGMEYWFTTSSASRKMWEMHLILGGNASNFNWLGWTNDPTGGGIPGGFGFNTNTGWGGFFGNGNDFRGGYGDIGGGGGGGKGKGGSAGTTSGNGTTSGVNTEGTIVLPEINVIKNQYNMWQAIRWQHKQAAEMMYYHWNRINDLYEFGINTGNDLAYLRRIGDGINGIGGIGAGLNAMGGSFRLTNGAYNGNIMSLKHYISGWRGGSVARITTYNAVKWGTRIGLGSLGAGVIIGGIDIGCGVYADGGFGYNAQIATGSTVGGLAGGWAGAALGATWGGFFGGPPGFIIGGIIGGVGTGWAGTYVGGRIVGGFYW